MALSGTGLTIRDYRAAIIVLYRPHILDSPREVSVADQGLWRVLACQKTRTAASNASAAVNSMMAEDLIDLCHTIAYGPGTLVHTIFVKLTIF